MGRHLPALEEGSCQSDEGAAAAPAVSPRDVRATPTRAGCDIGKRRCFGRLRFVWLQSGRGLASRRPCGPASMSCLWVCLGSSRSQLPALQQPGTLRRRRLCAVSNRLKRLEPSDLAPRLDEDEHGTKDYYEHGMPAHCVACDGFEGRGASRWQVRLFVLPSDIRGRGDAPVRLVRRPECRRHGGQLCTGLCRVRR